MQVPEEAPVPAAAIHGEAPVPKALKPDEKPEKVAIGFGAPRPVRMSDIPFSL